MKLVGSLVMGVGALMCITLFTVERAYAGENDPPIKCTLETLNGQYLVAGNGMLIPPVPLFSIPAGAPPSVTAVAAYSIYNGDGTGTDYVTFTVDGVIAANGPTPTTYTLNTDCTGTRTVVNGPHFNIFVAIDGSALTEVSTDQGFAVSTFDRRAGSER